MQGRNRKGSIYVWAAGNGGTYYDSCAADGYSSSIYTISVGSADQSAHAAVYDEQCAAKMVVTFNYNSQTAPSPDEDWTPYDQIVSIKCHRHVQFCSSIIFNCIPFQMKYSMPTLFARLLPNTYLVFPFKIVNICKLSLDYDVRKTLSYTQTTTTLNGRCTDDFDGTSAATPLVSGVMALALQAK